MSRLSLYSSNSFSNIHSTLGRLNKDIISVLNPDTIMSDMPIIHMTTANRYQGILAYVLSYVRSKPVVSAQSVVEDISKACSMLVSDWAEVPGLSDVTADYITNFNRSFLMPAIAIELGSVRIASLILNNIKKSLDILKEEYAKLGYEDHSLIYFQYCSKDITPRDSLLAYAVMPSYEELSRAIKTPNYGEDMYAMFKKRELDAISKSQSEFIASSKCELLAWANLVRRLSVDRKNRHVFSDNTKTTPIFNQSYPKLVLEHSKGNDADVISRKMLDTAKLLLT